MKAGELKKNIGKLFRLRPLPIRMWGRHRLPPSDDQWMLDEVLERPIRIRIHNISTGHTKVLGSDNFKGFENPDFLILKCFLIMTPHGLDIEPMLWAPTGRRVHVRSGVRR